MHEDRILGVAPEGKAAVKLEYRRPGPGEKAELDHAIAHTSGVELAQAMVDATFNVDDRHWLEQRMLGLLHHQDPGIRSAAATCLGHVATFFGEADVEVVVPALEELMQDPRTRGYAQTALEDIAQLTNPQTGDAEESGATPET